MFGVLFCEADENSLIGVLLFHSESKANEALHSLVVKGNDYNSKLYESWNLKLCAVFNNIDLDDIPEIEGTEIHDGIFDYIDTNGKSNSVQIINASDVVCI